MVVDLSSIAFGDIRVIMAVARTSNKRKVLSAIARARSISAPSQTKSTAFDQQVGDFGSFSQNYTDSQVTGAYGPARHPYERVQFDFTCVKGVDYTVFFAVWDSSSDLLFMGWGVQAHPVRLVDFLF